MASGYGNSFTISGSQCLLIPQGQGRITGFRDPRVPTCGLCRRIEFPQCQHLFCSYVIFPKLESNGTHAHVHKHKIKKRDISAVFPNRVLF